MNLHSYIASSQSSTKPSSITSKTNKPSKHSNKENINFLNFSKLAINSSKSQDRFNTIDFIPNSILLNKYEQNKFQTEANSSLTYKTITNASHSRYKSIANMPYKIPIHETNFKRLPVKNEQKRQNNNNDNNKILGNFQKSFQSQNYSISLQQKQGDLVEIPEISSPEKEDNIKFIENEENYNGFLLLKNFGVLPQKNPAIIRKESFLSSFSNYENKSIMSFPDEITNSTHKNLLLFKKIQNTPKLLSNLLKKNKNIINNSFYHDKILKCGEKIEQSPNPMTKILDKTVLSTDSFEDSNVNNSVYKFLLCREKAYQLNPHSLRTQKEINPMMRSVLIDWMSEVSTEFGLKRQTLHQAIYYLDKCLETNKTLKKNTFQLVGVASLLIASKIEVSTTLI